MVHYAASTVCGLNLFALNTAFVSLAEPAQVSVFDLVSPMALLPSRPSARFAGPHELLQQLLEYLPRSPAQTPTQKPILTVLSLPVSHRAVLR